MKTAAEINFDYQRAINQAEDLDNAAADLKRTAQNSLEDVRSDLYRAWRSDSADSYRKKLAKVKEDMLTTAKNLNRAADTIRDIAREVRDAELNALRIAMERKG